MVIIIIHGFEGSFETDRYYWGKANFRLKWPADITQQDSSHAGNSTWNPRSTFKPSTLPMLWGPAWSTGRSLRKSLGMPAHLHMEICMAGNSRDTSELPQLATPATEGWKFPLSTQALLESAQLVERVTTAPCTGSRAQHRLQKRKSTLNLIYFYCIYIRANIWKC